MATPQIPQNVLVQQANGQVLVSWDQVPGVISYSVQRSTDNISYTTLAAPTAPQYLDSAVTVGVQYYYQVASTVSGPVTGSYSNPQSIVPTLSGQMTLGQLRLQAQQRADRVNSQFLTTQEWNVNINQSYFELYDILIQKFGNEYYVAPPLQIPLNGVSQFYDLPNGVNYSKAKPFYKLLGVDLSLNTATNAWLTLKKFEFISRNNYIYPQITANLLTVGGLRYRIVGNQLEFIPIPASSQVAQVWYIPRMVELLSDTDIADGVSGWTEYIIVDAAIKALQKEESDVSVLMAQKQALIARIEAAAENRDAGEPERISQTRLANDYWGGGDGWNNGPIGGY